MPIKNLIRVQADLKPATKDKLEEAAKKHQLQRTTLVRMLVVYGLRHLKDVLKTVGPRD